MDVNLPTVNQNYQEQSLSDYIVCSIYCKILNISDTDSLLLEIECEDIFEEILKMIDLMDTSNYPPLSKCFTMERKAVPGKFKDECAGAVIEEFIGKFHYFEI